jgi:hypothetical protein
MVLFFATIVLFNFVTYKMRKHLTKNQIVHIWAVTIILEMIFDIFIDEKTNGYWYFWKGIDWTNVLAYTVLIPPVNVMFLNWYPFNSSWLKKIGYLFLWVILILGYEKLVLIQPLGYFHYGWWKLIYSAIIDPILFIILLAYFKWIRKIENN